MYDTRLPENKALCYLAKGGRSFSILSSDLNQLDWSEQVSFSLSDVGVWLSGHICNKLLLNRAKI